MPKGLLYQGEIDVAGDQVRSQRMFQAMWIGRSMNISALLVAIGVSGEFVGNWIATPIRKRIDLATEIEIARLNEEAGGAKKAAGDAMERAAKLEVEAEQERLARVKIEEKVAWRRLTKDQQSAIGSRLK
jgi:hypothetical protein